MNTDPDKNIEVVRRDFDGCSSGDIDVLYQGSTIPRRRIESAPGGLSKRYFGSLRKNTPMTAMPQLGGEAENRGGCGFSFGRLF